MAFLWGMKRNAFGKQGVTKRTALRAARRDVVVEAKGMCSIKSDTALSAASARRSCLAKVFSLSRW